MLQRIGRAYSAFQNTLTLKIKLNVTKGVCSVTLLQVNKLGLKKFINFSAMFCYTCVLNIKLNGFEFLSLENLVWPLNKMKPELIIFQILVLIISAGV